MFEGLFSSTGYYEYPSFEMAVFSLLLSFVLSSVIAFTYKLTYKGETFPNHLFQAIILGSIVTSMIMMAVGDNFAVGFGIIGAVAIIRFRTLISDPRNIIFMFAGISIGITTGVYGYSIAIAGSLIFSLVAFLLNFSSFGKFPESEYEIVVEIDLAKPDTFPDDDVSNFCAKFDVVMQRHTETLMRKRYVVKLKQGVKAEDVYSGLKGVDGIQTVRVDKSETRIRL